MNNKLTDTGRFFMDTAADNKAKIEVFGQLFRFVTPLLITIGLWSMSQMTTTLDSIDVDVSKNRISVIKLEANQEAFWSAFNSYRQSDAIRYKSIEAEVDEVNSELDGTVKEIHRLEIEMKGNHTGSGNRG